MNILRPLACLVVAATTAFAAGKVIDPATLKDKVTIAPGKRLIVEFTQDGNALSKPKIVAKADDKTPTVSLDFDHHEKLLILNTQNGFPKTLRFRALFRLKGRKDYVETSILPLMAGLSSFESWGDPIEELVLFDFKLTDEKP